MNAKMTRAIARGIKLWGPTRRPVYWNDRIWQAVSEIEPEILQRPTLYLADVI